MTVRYCSVKGCERRVHGNGLCHAHYMRVRRGDPDPLRPLPKPTTDAERFWAKVDAEGDCWIWTGKLTTNGYGRAYQRAHERTEQLAHRWAWELLVGPIPEGMTIDHLCRIRHCVNPDHLEVVSMRENMLRGYSPFAQKARQTHCKRGHPLSGDNLYQKPDGGRVCRACKAMMMKRWHARHQKN